METAATETHGMSWSDDYEQCQNSSDVVIDLTVPVILQADIAKYCLSECLCPVRHWTKAKCNYLQIEKEILIVVIPNSQKYTCDWPRAFTS